MSYQRPYTVGVRIIPTKSDRAQELSDQVASVINTKSRLKMFSHECSVMGQFTVDPPHLITSLNDIVPTLVTTALRTTFHEQLGNEPNTDFRVTVFVKNPNSSIIGGMVFEHKADTVNPVKFDKLYPMVPVELSVFCEKSEVLSGKEKSEFKKDDPIPVWDRDLLTAFQYVAGGVASKPTTPLH